jgi:peptidyl-tRNA hydrolase, PTH1 family
VSAFARLLGFFRRKKPPESADILVFGIGNPGEKYRDTRHNAGFMAVDHLSGLLSEERTIREPLFTAVAGTLWGIKVALVKPCTFVNACGPAFDASTALLGVPRGSVLVIVDDYHLPLGALRLRRGGSDGGHNGLASIIGCCGEDFPRLRVGIGPLAAGENAVDFVLGRFDEREIPVLDAAVRAAAEAVRVFCTGGIEQAMNRFNASRAAPGSGEEKTNL